MEKLFNWGINLINRCMGIIPQLFPHSPFMHFLEVEEKVPLLALINYFVPLDAMIAISQAWAIVMMALYGKKVLARWIKLVK